MAGPVYTVEAAFVANPFGTLVWTDITAFLEEAPIGWDRGKQSDLARTEPGKLTLVLKNTDGRFDPGNTASPYYPYVQTRTPIRVRATYNAVTYDRWSGFVKRWPQRWSKNGTYGTVTVTAVDALEVGLGQTFGPPYETIVQTDYSILSTTNGQYFCFDEAAPPFADIQNPTAGRTTSLTAKGTTANIASVAGAQRKGVRFTGTAGVVWSVGAALKELECWLKVGSQPDTTQLMYGTSMVLVGVDAPGNAAFPAAVVPYNQNSSIGGVFYVNPSASPLCSSSAGIAAWLHRPLANQMLNDNQASFITDLSEWTATNIGTFARVASGGSANIPRQYDDAWCAQIGNTTANWSIVTANLIPVTASKRYGCSFTFKNTTGVAQTLVTEFDWYTSGSVFISTTSTTGLAAQTGVNDFVGGQALAPSNAAYVKIRVKSSGSFAGICYIDGFMLIGGTNAPPDGDAFWTAQYLPSRSVGAPYYVPPSLGTNTTSPIGIDLYISVPNVGLHRIPLEASWFGAWHLLSAGYSNPGNSIAGYMLRMDKADYSGNRVYLVGGTTNAVIFQGVGSNMSLGHSGTTSGQYSAHDLTIDEVYCSASTTNSLTLGITPTATLHDKHYDLIMQGGGVFRPLSFPAQDTGARADAVLDAIGWPATERVVDVGATQMQASGNNSGKTAATLLNDAAEAELGLLFIDGRGRPNFQSRRHAVSYTPTLTFGEAETPYSDAEIPFDDTRTYNDVQVTQTATTGTAYVATASDPASQLKNGVLTLPKTLPLTTTADTDATARTLLNRYRNPQRRIEEITVALRTNPTVSPAVLAADIGDVVGFMRRPPGLAAISIPGRIVGIREKGSAETFEVTFLLDPIPADAWIAGDAKQSIAGVTTYATY